MITTRYPLRDEDVARLNNDFTYHMPFGDQPERYEAIRATARVLAFTICEFCPTSRERSIALTHLEMAVMVANKSIACNEKEPKE